MEFVPQLIYPLPAVALDKDQLDRIIQPALPSMKHALGLCEKTSTKVLFFPIQYGGYGMTDLHLTPMACQAKFVI